MKKPSFIVFSLLFLFSCSNNRLDVDVSSVKINEVKIDRLDTDVFNANGIDEKLHEQLKEKYSNFYLSYQHIISGGNASDSVMLHGLNLFASDSAMKQAFLACEKVYPTTNWLETDITHAFRYFNYHFPNRALPRVITYMSGFNFSILRIDSTIGIGLDMYLGKDNKFYRMLQFPQYKSMTMAKEYLVSDFVRGWMTTEFPNVDEKKNLLSEIIYNGKLMYLVDALLPTVNDTIKIGYTNNQLEWCKRNEYNMWAYFVQKKLLYSSDPAEVNKYISEGPFTSAFSKESPARVGIWIGWQIVRAYMDRHPNISLNDLMNDPDSQKILSASKYKPTK